MSSRSSSQRRLARARASAWWALAVLVAAHLGFAAVLLWWPLPIRDPHFAARLASLERLRAEQRGQGATVVMLGSSRTMGGLRAQELARQWGRVAVGNFGHPGGGAVRSLLQWRRLERAPGVRPDLLLVEVLPVLLVSPVCEREVSESAMPLRSLSRADLAVVGPYLRPPRPGLVRDSVAEWAMPLWTHREFLVSRALPQLLPFAVRWEHRRIDQEAGLFPGEGSLMDGTEEWRQRARERERRSLAVDEYRIDPLAERAFRELLSATAGKGVAVALVLMPEGPACQSWYPPETGPVLSGLLANLRREFGVPVVDARDWFPDERYFSDSHHLLEHGARAFTVRLARELAPPLPSRGAGGLVERER